MVQTPQFHFRRHRFNLWSRKFLTLKRAAKNKKKERRGWGAGGGDGRTSREVESVLSVKPKGK